MDKTLTKAEIDEIVMAANNLKEILQKHNCNLCFDRNIDGVNEIHCVRKNVVFLDPNLGEIKDTAEPMHTFVEVCSPLLFDFECIKSYDSNYDTMVDTIDL